jgi:hypothetical protein
MPTTEPMMVGNGWCAIPPLDTVHWTCASGIPIFNREANPGSSARMRVFSESCAGWYQYWSAKSLQKV